VPLDLHDVPKIVFVRLGPQMLARLGVDQAHRNPGLPANQQAGAFCGHLRRVGTLDYEADGPSERANGSAVRSRWQPVPRKLARGSSGCSRALCWRTTEGGLGRGGFAFASSAARGLYRPPLAIDARLGQPVSSFERGVRWRSLQPRPALPWTRGSGSDPYTLHP